MNKFVKKTLYLLMLFCLPVTFIGCYSVFNGGTGGIIVDSESTSNPKKGIAYVDIYAYTSSSIRDSDFNNWKEGTIFSPSNSYYGHTSTDANGNFSISNIVWKEYNPDFGKDADYTTIYLLYFHENYGLVKDKTVITSDSTSDTVYAELTAIRKTTSLNISIYDVSNSNLTNNTMLVKIEVPQSTDTLPLSPKIYEQNITGTGTISINYPRWQNTTDKESGKEYEPQIQISYQQSSDQITWKACYNANNQTQDYSFMPDDFKISKTIKNSSYDISLYGKATKITFPVINGVCGDSEKADSDGKIIKMMAKDSNGDYTIDCGETTTFAQNVGTNGTQSHGNFNGLGENCYWIDNNYTQKFSEIMVKFYLDGGTFLQEKTLRSDTSSYYFNL